MEHNAYCQQYYQYYTQCTRNTSCVAIEVLTTKLNDPRVQGVYKDRFFVIGMWSDVGF